MSKSTLMVLVAALVALFLGSAGILWFFGGDAEVPAQVVQATAAGTASEQAQATGAAQAATIVKPADFGLLLDGSIIMMILFIAMTFLGALALIFFSGERDVNGTAKKWMSDTQTAIAKFCMFYGGTFTLVQLFGWGYGDLVPGRTLVDLAWFYGIILFFLFGLKMSGLGAKLMKNESPWVQYFVLATILFSAAYDVRMHGIAPSLSVPTLNFPIGEKRAGKVVTQKGVCIGADCPVADKSNYWGPVEVYENDFRKPVPVVRTRNDAPVQTVPTSNGGNQTQAVQGNAPTAGQPSSQQNPGAGTPANDGGNTTGRTAFVPDEGATYEIPGERGSAFPFWMIMGFLGVVTLVLLAGSVYKRVFEPIGLIFTLVVLYAVTTTAVGGIFFGGDLAAGLRYEELAYQRAQLPNAHVMTVGKVPMGLETEPWVVVMCGPHEGGKAEVRVGHGAFSEHLLGDMRAGDVQISPAALEGASHWVMPIKADGFVREMAQGYPSDLLAANKGVGPCHHYLYANPRVKIVLQCMIDRGGYAPGVERDCGLVIN